MSTLNSETFKPLLARLVNTPEYFTTTDLTSTLEHILTPSTPSSTASSSDAAGTALALTSTSQIPATQIGAFLTALHVYRIDRRPEMLVAAASFLRSRALKADIEARSEDFVVDIVGTGGDGHNTFNVSTTAAVVAAGAGARVCKHGSRASTSSSGSADLLQSLGCLFTPPTASTPMHIARIPFTFILAPHYHPTLALLAPHRKSLPFRTMFNVLGPLINPANPSGLVLGVAEKELGMTFARSLRDSGSVKRALVVCGAEGLDEISCAGDTYAWELKEDGTIEEKTLNPSQFGLGIHPLREVAGGTANENAETFKRLLTGSGSEGDSSGPGNLGAVLDFVLLNASALLVVAGIASDFADGVRLARESISSGKAWEALQTFKREGERAAAQVAAAKAS